MAKVWKVTLDAKEEEVLEQMLWEYEQRVSEGFQPHNEPLWEPTHSGERWFSHQKNSRRG